MNAPTVDRFRYPFRRLVPGETHTVFLHWADDLDVSGSTFTVGMFDAFTATPITGVAYVLDVTGAATGSVIATASIPADIDTDAMFEIRVRQDDATIIAGAAQFSTTVVPVTP